MATSQLLADRYRITAELARGGTADVLDAIDVCSGRAVVVKRMRRRWCGDPRVESHYTSEIDALRRLARAPVARLLDEGTTDDGLRFLILERVGGPALDQWMEAAPPLARALAVFHWLLEAVDVVHSLGVVHGDLKPGNAMLTADLDGVRLIDFGLASLESDAARPERPHVFGTPEYMAPELIAGAPRSVATDVYALGAMLYELISGAPPFIGVDTEDTARRQLDDAVVPPSARTPLAVGAPLDDVAVRALAKHPRDRFASVTQLRRALARSRLGWSTERPVGRRDWDHTPTLPYRAAAVAASGAP